MATSMTPRYPRSGTHITLWTLQVGGGAAFIAYGRFSLKAIAAAPVSALRVLQALAVLAALILVDYAPAWYRLTHAH